ncbi:oxidoreductase [Desulfitobacterium hafniense]|uniref:Oxidoreductase n=1 Tax=Desulfitobacterium hafniense TaxID=49338 RepID=A0A0W1JKN2_DESHA|nr:proton-conducting transporter membrane subunit [Desulfitobacterium hafniense]KTE92115.1 oxidoreductase [Desulfitobacterium hafniense]
MINIERGIRVGTMGLSLMIAILGILFLGWNFHMDNFSGQWHGDGFACDGLTAFFLLVLLLGQGIASLYGLGYMKDYEGKRSLLSFSLSWAAFLGSMAGVLIVNNGFYFLFLWELMSLFSFLLVIYEHEESSNRRAAFIYFVMTHVGTVFLIAAVLYLYSKTGSFLYGDWAAITPTLSPGEKNGLFLCFLIGFGTKAGLVPFHIWLPYAHPVAPSPVSALMSGVMVKIALYMMMRWVWLTLAPMELWWGGLMLALGVLSAFIGILYACVEQDVKRLLAYSTVENMGILTMALGTAMIARTLGYSDLVVLALAAFFWHGVHHLLFKSGLFMAAGNIIQATHTKRLDQMGGLLKKMPRTGLWAMVGAVGLSALPPLGGFWGEWLLFHALWKTSVQVEGGLFKLALPLSLAALAFISALALATMVKWFAGAFLGQARSTNAANAQELPWPQTVSMAMAMMLTLLATLYPQGLWKLISVPIHVLKDTNDSPLTDSLALPLGADFFNLITPYILLLGLFSVTLYQLSARKRKRVAGTWNCGVPLTPRMQYTGLGITMPLRIAMKKVLAFRPIIDKKFGETPYVLQSLHYRSRTREITEEVFYRPAMKLLLRCAERIRILQTGSIHTYLAYILITLVVVLIWTM